MARLTKEQREERDNQILADWKLGTSQNDLAKIYGVSKGKVNSLCKGVPQDLEPLVNAQIEINQKLTELNDQELTAYKEEVINREKALLLFQQSALKGQKLANNVLDHVSDRYTNADESDKDKMTVRAIMTAKEHSVITQRNKESVLGKEHDTTPPPVNNFVIQTDAKRD